MKNLFFIQKKLIITVVALTVMFSSCKKEEPVNARDLFVYAPAGSASSNLLTGNTIVVLGKKILTTSGNGFPVMLTRSFSADVQVTASIDTGLVNTYNKTNNTRFPSLPAGAFTLGSSGSVIIKTGEMQSADSILVRPADVIKLKTGSTTYLVPVVLNTATGGAAVSSTRQVMYVQVNVISIAVAITDVSGKSMVDILLNRLGTGTTGTSLIDLKATLNTAIADPTLVTIVENPALIDTYNKANNTNYKPFPAGSFKLLKDNTTIAANATAAGDNMQLQLPDLSLFAADTEYLLAVQIKENADGGLPADAAKHVVYIHINVFVSNIDPANSGLSGTTITRMGWTVTASSSYSNNAISRVLDGDNATAWDSDHGLPQWVQLDMGVMKRVKGFPIVPSYEYAADNFINMDVLSSNDGTVWKLQGKYVGTTTSGTANSPDIKMVKFVTPVTARYFKFSITKTTDGSYAGMGELNAVE